MSSWKLHNETATKLQITTFTSYKGYFKIKKTPGTNLYDSFSALLLKKMISLVIFY